MCCQAEFFQVCTVAEKRFAFKESAGKDRTYKENNLVVVDTERMMAIVLFFFLMSFFFFLLNGTMQSDELAHLSKVYSVIAGACIPIFHCIFNNYV